LTIPLVLAGALTGLVPAGASAATCQSWTGTQPPDPGTSSNILNGITVLSACNAWAVGLQSDGRIATTLIEHWNGASWTVVPSPSPGTTESELQAIRARSATDIWAVGFSDVTSSTSETGSADQTLIEHWDGHTWKVMPSPDPGTVNNQLFGVRTVSASDAWAVGFTSDGTVNLAGNRALILHWNGTKWASVATPSLGTGVVGSQLLGVAATSGTNAWAVGTTYRGSGSSLRTASLILRWNGTKWARVASPSPAPGSGLSGVGVTSAGNAWAVGAVGRLERPSQTFILHWNGRAWARVPSPSPGGSPHFDFLNSVTAVSASDVWAVGTVFTESQGDQSLALHWNGRSWQQVMAPKVADEDQFTAVAASSARNVWMAGFTVPTAAPFQVIAFHCC
jgi:hypothetical protein